MQQMHYNEVWLPEDYQAEASEEFYDRWEEELDRWEMENPQEWEEDIYCYCGCGAYDDCGSWDDVDSL